MGGEVERVPAGASVAPQDDPARPEAFGAWLRRERELRGISSYFLAARTKLAPERIRGIEDGTEPLRADGHGRGTARALARAIGADPDQASMVLAAEHDSRGADSSDRGTLRWAAIGRSIAAALALGLAGWMLYSWLWGRETSADGAAVVHRPDYVERLLEGDGS